MVRKVCPAALTGILYYQGEEDAGQTDQYDELMDAMIRSWRKSFRDAELPFLFVQLPMWLDWDAEDTFQWAKTRLSQAAVRDAVRNTGMICLLDEGEYGNIHPVAKRPVGERLAELAGAMLTAERGSVPRATGHVRGRGHPDGDADAAGDDSGTGRRRPCWKSPGRTDGCVRGGRDPGNGAAPESRKGGRIRSCPVRVDGLVGPGEPVRGERTAAGTVQPVN